MRQREFAYNNVLPDESQPTLWTDAHVDGMKTGQLLPPREGVGCGHNGPGARAEERAFQRRLIAVVLGAASEAARTQETLRLINHGYAAFDTVAGLPSWRCTAKPAIWKVIAESCQSDRPRRVRHGSV